MQTTWTRRFLRTLFTVGVVLLCACGGGGGSESSSPSTGGGGTGGGTGGGGGGGGGGGISAPATPLSLNATAGNAFIRLGWAVSATATSYEVRRVTAGAGGPYLALPSSTGLSTTTFVDNTVVNGQAYYYVVQATNAGGSSPDSAPVTATPRAPPELEVSAMNAPLRLPANCERTFTIRNSGPPSSELFFLVADEGALAGFLKITGATGLLQSGQSAVVRVSVLPDFVASEPSLVGATLGLTIHTPNASNYVKFPISIPIEGFAHATQRLIGQWLGTWAGQSVGRHNPGQPEPKASVSGTWQLQVDSADAALGKLSGALRWNGADSYFTYTPDANGPYGVATPVPFVPNRTVPVLSSNATLSDNGCQGIAINIFGAAGAVNPSDAFYGPSFMAVFDVDTRTVTSFGNGFTTNPYNPVNMDTGLASGSVTGTKP